MRNFFIFSLPRSGSAWLSMFLSGPQSFCYHEPLADGGVESLRERMRGRDGVVGAIDTSAYQKAAVVLPNLQGLDLYVLIRDYREIEKSAYTMGLIPEDPVREWVKFNNATKRLVPIWYSQFRDIEYLRLLWQQLIGTPFDEERARLVQEMQIQRSLEMLIRRIIPA